MRNFYDGGDVQVYCGDALHYLKTIPDKSFDLCLTDPPYGINIAKRGEVGRTKHKFAASNWDANRPAKEYFDEIQRVSKVQIIWGGNYFADLLKATRGWLVWFKRPNNTTDFADCELAWTSQDANARVLEHLWNGFRKHEPEQRFKHPTQKPLRLMRWCIQQVKIPVRSVIDPFAGTGTSLVAARELGAFAVGIDQGEDYCEIMRKRLLGLPAST